MSEYAMPPTPPTPPTMQYQAGELVVLPWCASAAASVVLPAMLAATQWLGIFESVCSWVATTVAPSATAPAA
eukprot:7378187-Prymnesium_polylepis.1